MSCQAISYLLHTALVLLSFFCFQFQLCILGSLNYHPPFFALSSKFMRKNFQRYTMIRKEEHTFVSKMKHRCKRKVKCLRKNGELIVAIYSFPQRLMNIWPKHSGEKIQKSICSGNLTTKLLIWRSSKNMPRADKEKLGSIGSSS